MQFPFDVENFIGCDSHGFASVTGPELASGTFPRGDAVRDIIDRMGAASAAVRKRLLTSPQCDLLRCCT